jgi:hypothetical protein
LNVDMSNSNMALFANPDCGPEYPWVPWNTWPQLGGIAWYLSSGQRSVLEPD